MPQSITRQTNGPVTGRITPRLPRRANALRLGTLALMLWIVPALAMPVASAQDAKPVSDRKSNPAASVELTIDYGDGAQKRFPAVPWKSGMSVLDALVWADKHPHGIQLKYRGKRELAIVSQIDDLKNAGGDQKNWIFYVDAKLAESSCGAIKIRPKQKILWRFEVYK